MSRLMIIMIEKALCSFNNDKHAGVQSDATTKIHTNARLLERWLFFGNQTCIFLLLCEDCFLEAMTHKHLNYHGSGFLARNHFLVQLQRCLATSRMSALCLLCVLLPLDSQRFPQFSLLFVAQKCTSTVWTALDATRFWRKDWDKTRRFSLKKIIEAVFFIISSYVPISISIVHSKPSRTFRSMDKKIDVQPCAA